MAKSQVTEIKNSVLKKLRVKTEKAEKLIGKGFELVKEIKEELSEITNPG